MSAPDMHFSGPHNNDRDVAIIGGGVAGMTAGLALARSGAKITLYERAPDLRAFGAGLQLTPNGSHALASLGIDPSTLGIAARALVVRSGVSGRQIARFALPGGYYFCNRGDLLGTIAEAAQSAGVTVRTDARAELGEGGFTPGTPEEHTPQLVIGADGVHSTSRTTLSADPPPAFTGYVAWRATLAAEAPPEVGLWLGPGWHVVSYPLKGGRVNFVGVRAEASWREDGWHHAAPPEDFAAAFADGAGDVRALVERAETAHRWALIRRPVAARWHGRVGQIPLALAGDAAHPTLPFLAQGANLAIEDGVALAHATAQASALDEGLAAYQAKRRARAEKVIAAANTNARNYHFAGPARIVAALGLGAIGRIAPDRFIGRYDWIYGYKSEA